MTLASGLPNDGDGLSIRLDARIVGATLKAAETAKYALGANRYVWLLNIIGGRARFHTRILLGLRVLAAFGDHAASRNLRSSRSRLARPYIWRLMVFSRLICPSVWPLLQSRDSAARTAS